MACYGARTSMPRSNTMRHRRPPSQTWRTFLGNHVSELVSIDFFTVPTTTFRVLYFFVVLRHERREIVQFNATYHPTAEWTAQQLVEAFPFDTAPRYLLRDRDGIYSVRFRSRAKNLGIEEVPSSPRRTWRTRRQVIPGKSLGWMTQRRVRRAGRFGWWFLVVNNVS